LGGEARGRGHERVDHFDDVLCIKHGRLIDLRFCEHRLHLVVGHHADRDHVELQLGLLLFRDVTRQLLDVVCYVLHSLWIKFAVVGLMGMGGWMDEWMNGW